MACPRLKPMQLCHAVLKANDITLIRRAASPRAVDVALHTITGEEAVMDASKGNWEVVYMDDEEQHYLTNSVDDEVLFSDDLFKVAVMKEQRDGCDDLILVEMQPGGAPPVVVEEKWYKDQFLLKKLQLRVPSLHEDIAVVGLIFATPKGGQRIFLPFTSVVRDILVLNNVSATQPHQWIHKRLPKLEAWLKAIGVEAMLLMLF